MTGFSDRPRIRFYAGPSILWSEISALCSELDATIEILPPVEQGDLLRDVHCLPDVIGIIDGYFYQVPAVLHKEILIALEAGTRVLGAASLGALRAAELDVLGMEGVGRIYQMFSDGQIDGDDEVAVQHGPAEVGFRPLTVPLVNVRHAIRLAVEQAVISTTGGLQILSAARDLHFVDRTWQRVFDQDCFRAIENAEGFCEFVSRHAPDLKHDDAVTLVRTIADRVSQRSEWPVLPRCRVKSSKYTYLMWHEYAGGRSDERHVSDSQVISLQKILDREFPLVVDRVARRIIACEEAADRGLTSDALEILEQRFRQERALQDDDDFRRWLSLQGLTRGDLATWLQACDIEQKVHSVCRTSSSQEPGHQIVQSVASRRGLATHDLLTLTLSRQTIAFDLPLIRELKCTGRFAEARRTAASILKSTESAFEENQRLRTIMEALGDLVRKSLDEWAAGWWGIAPEDLPAELSRRAIHSGAEFIETVRLCQLHFQHGGERSETTLESTVDGNPA